MAPQYATRAGACEAVVTSTPQTWLYHRTEPARIFTGATAIADALAAGWADTPAAFTSRADAPVDPPVRTRTRGRTAKEIASV